MSIPASARPPVSRRRLPPHAPAWLTGLALLCLLGGGPLAPAAAAETPDLFAAIALGDLAQVRTLVEKNPALVNSLKVVPVAEWAGMKSRDREDPDFQGKLSPLVQAVVNDRLEIAAWLLSRGARSEVYVSFEGVKDPSLGLWEGTALFSAVERGDPRMVKLLLDAKADPAQKARFYGGPPPPKPGEGGPDRSLFGGAYYRDSRARLTVLDLCLAGNFRSLTLYRLIKRQAPRLRPVCLDNSLFYAAANRDRELFSRLMDEGQRPDALVLAALMRNGDAEALHGLAGQGMSGLPDTPVWSEAGQMMDALDGFWYDRILGRLDKPAQFGPALRSELLARTSGLAGQLAAVNGHLEGSRQLLQSIGYPSDRSGLNFAVRFLFEPWLEPRRDLGRAGTPGASSPALVSLAYSQLLAASLLGRWASAEGPEWRLEFQPENIHNAGVDGLGKNFEAWLAPWRVAVEDGPAGPERDGWVLRIKPDDRPWLTVRLDEAGLHVYDPAVQRSTLFRRSD